MQAIVDADEKKRYDLRFEASAEEPTTTVADSITDATTAAAAETSGEPKGLWWIKANQGHSMKVCIDILAD